MRVPLVERARVDRVWPHTIRIEVVERQPFAMALVEGQLHFLDKEMRPFAPVGAQDSIDLPVLTGMVRADLLEPDEEMMELLASAHKLLESLPQRAIKGGGALSEVHLDRVWGLSVVFSDLPATVRLGFGGYEDEWARLEKVCADLKERGEMERAVLIDLDSDRRVVVRLGREAA
jgi:cell division septal protein FtsQ